VFHWLKKKLTPADGMAITMEFHSGSGALSCSDCGHTEEVHLFTHGFGPTSQCAMGYQCQSCAQFVTFDSEPVGEQGIAALKAQVNQSRRECGGEFARDMPIMCSRCKSMGVEYDLWEIT
jgi:hypothetical protein